MTDNPYNRTVLYPLEKPLADDLNQEFSQGDRSIRDTMFQLLQGQQGFIWDSFQISPSAPPALSVVMKQGIAYQDAPADVPTAIGGVLGLNDLSRYKPLLLANDLTVAVPAPPGANSRIDMIEVRYDRKLNNLQSRNFLDPNTSAFSPANVAKTLDFNLDGTLGYYAAAAVPTTAIAYKSGVVAVSPVPPTVDAGYMVVAYITVVAGAVTITAPDISDQRSRILLAPGTYLGRQIITATGTYTPIPGARRAFCSVVAGGGGAGGIAGGGGQVAAVAGGASGITCYRTITAAPGTYIAGGPVTIGAAGAGGAAGNNPGTAGGDTTLVIDAVTITAKGGLGSAGSAGNANSFSAEAVGHGAGSVGFDYFAGEPGQPSHGSNSSGAPPPATIFLAGNGGSSPFGIGGVGDTGGPAVPKNAQGFGSGGGGAVSYGAGNLAGGNGTAGVVIVDEYA